jgi:hypothetical protein
LQKRQISFSFLVLAYNHESYIIEHLESIKYQIKTYGKEVKVDILINDDCSTDRTVELIDNWLKLNKELFNRVLVIKNKNNKGTCLSVTHLFSLIETKLFKLTAADDIYSYENIFEGAFNDEDVAFISGFPLYLENSILREYFISNFLTIATSVVYKKKGILNQFVNFSYNNAPNMFYNLNLSRDIRVISFVQNFDVTEDWPIQIAISRFYPQNKIKYIDKVFVYYRRTAGSTYIVANERFTNDKLKIFKDLINNSANIFSKLRLKSRLFAFKSSNKIVSRIINLDLYIFFFQSLFRIRSIYSQIIKLNLNKSLHVKHWEFIKIQAFNFKNDHIKNKS